LRQNQASAKLNTSIELENRSMDSVPLKLMEVHIKLSNVGAVPLNIDYVHIVVRQVIPIDDKTKSIIVKQSTAKQSVRGKYLWPTLIDQSENPETFLEPGESDEADFDFFVPEAVKTVEIYSNVAQEKNSDFSWQQTQLYDLIPPAKSE
jgi:hypothetical protein